MVLQKNVTCQNLGYQVLKKKSELGLPSLDNHVHLCSCLGRPSHESSYFGSNVEILYPKRFQDLESQVLNRAIIVKTWGHGVAKNVTTFQNLGYQVLKEKCKNQTCGCQVLTIMFTCVSCLGRPSHESFLFGSNVEILWPKRFQELESQVLNRAIIVKTWGHGVAKNVTTFQNLACQVLNKKC